MAAVIHCILNTEKLAEALKKALRGGEKISEWDYGLFPTPAEHMPFDGKGYGFTLIYRKGMRGDAIAVRVTKVTPFDKRGRPMEQESVFLVKPWLMFRFLFKGADGYIRGKFINIDRKDWATAAKHDGALGKVRRDRKCQYHDLLLPGRQFLEKDVWTELVACILTDFFTHATIKFLDVSYGNEDHNHFRRLFKTQKVRIKTELILKDIIAAVKGNKGDMGEAHKAVKKVFNDFEIADKDLSEGGIPIDDGMLEKLARDTYHHLDKYNAL